MKCTIYCVQQAKPISENFSNNFENKIKDTQSIVLNTIKSSANQNFNMCIRS